jgi:hypothetical protein
MKRPQAHDISACGPAQAGASLNVTAGQTVNLVEGGYSLALSSYEMVAAVGKSLR